MLGIYNDFLCIADKCPSTCCSGWKIVVDDEAYVRFDSISDISLHDDIISNIISTGNERRFINHEDGRCAMLDKDGLCRIQRNFDEKMLCNTCRKFPRLISKHGGFIWMSMAASCPVVADYIIDGISFYMINDNGSILPIKLQDIPFIADEILDLQIIIRDFFEKKKDSREFINLYKKFIYTADVIMDIIIENYDITYLEGSFDYFENDKKPEEILFDIEKFEKLMLFKSKIFSNYASYKIYTRYLEYPNENVNDRICYVLGEIFVIYTISFSFFSVKGFCEMDKGSLCKIFNWVYRLSAHNSKLEEKLKVFYYIGKFVL